MLGTITTDKKGKPKLDATTRVSSFQPTQEVADFTNLLKKDYQIGEQIQSTPYEEFNDFTFLDRMSEDQKAWNSYSPKESGEPDEAWRWLGVRPIVRQKILGIASHVIAAMSKPSVFAQNDLDEEDKEAERVMGTMLEYNIRNSEYPLSFLFGVLDAMINPVAYFDLSYNNAHQSIKVKGEDGYKRTKVIDEELSGFQIGVTPPDEILITNVNEFNLQKQRAIMRRKIVDYDYLEAKYSDHENFQYVTPGVKSFYDPGGKLFYDQDDDNYATMGEEVT